MDLKKAFSLLEVREVGEESRTITGIATTPKIDSYGDIVERTSKPSLAEQYLNGAPSDEGAGDGLHN